MFTDPNTKTRKHMMAKTPPGQTFLVIDRHDIETAREAMETGRPGLVRSTLTRILAEGHVETRPKLTSSLQAAHDDEIRDLASRAMAIAEERDTWKRGYVVALQFVPDQTAGRPVVLVKIKRHGSETWEPAGHLDTAKLDAGTTVEIDLQAQGQ